MPLIYTMQQLPTTTATLPPSETIMTPLEWFNDHYTFQEGIDELKEDPTLKDCIYEDAFTALLSVGWYNKDDHSYGIADDDSCMHYGMIDSLLTDENVATIQGCSDFVRVWEINTLPKLLEDRELLTANVGSVLRMLLSWKQQGVYLPSIILSLMKQKIESWKDRDTELYTEFNTWFNCN